MKRYIAEGLERYLSKNMNPWHMPGHKRKNLIDGDSTCHTEKVDIALDAATLIDVTEVPGTDDLHHPEEMIMESMKELTRVYGTYASYYLVNGSTCGILTSISACFYGSEKQMGIVAGDENIDILIAENCHKSVYNAVELLGLTPKIIKPEKKVDKLLDGSISTEMIEEYLSQHKAIKAVVITSPTYEGIVSDIKAISDITKKQGVKLIVDEAHGAHLPFVTGCEGFPSSAIHSGADIVVQSIHKTLTGLTQTAILHVNNQELDEGVRKYLSVYMSSSPSYVLLAGMERAISRGEQADYGKYYEALRNFKDRGADFNTLYILNEEGSKTQAYGFDPSKIIIVSKCSSGKELQEALGRLGNIEVEMVGTTYVVLISTYMDTKEDFEKLYDTLKKVDEEFKELFAGKIMLRNSMTHRKQSMYYTLVGKKSKENIYAYPPGSYIIRENDVITREAIDKIVDFENSGIKIYGRLS